MLVLQPNKAFPRTVSAPPDYLYWYSAKTDRVIDGDTIEATLDLGFHIAMKERFRLYGINAYELTDKDPQKRQLALLGKQFVTDQLMPEDKPIVINSIKDEQEKYGRWLAVIYYQDSANAWHDLNQELIDKGLAVEYFP